MDLPWTLSPQVILDHFQVDPSRGLTSRQAAKHAEIYGTNGMQILLLLFSSFALYSSLSLSLSF
jgi:Cation transporter/ATPase, N-terminus